MITKFHVSWIWEAYLVERFYRTREHNCLELLPKRSSCLSPALFLVFSVSPLVSLLLQCFDSSLYRHLVLWQPFP